ncbi:hypothetical protein GCM10009676_45410 [Prauserella halophila]|uniref:Immunity protein Imm1 n=1 Tax=Prauserella halophila TaxID=185641 RepID=A0ABP4H7V1_9PSEU|nr:Imm1 family immunity protein [Prauserella halophila]MCP2237599.1 Immunity protein Imm1 [Prauserella halophila]
MTDLLDRIGFHVDDVTDVITFLGQVRDLATRGVEVPHMWAVAAGPVDPTHEDHIELEFGISTEADKGALAFGAGDTIYVPAHGTNDEDIDYQLGGAHPAGFPPKAEVPIDKVIAALEQYVRTRQRPTVIDWALAD